MDKRIISTGVPSLDLLLGGGIPARQSMVVTGDPGSGKTILCSQIAFAHAARGQNVVLATIASESQDKLIEELRGFTFFDPERVGRELFLVSVYPALQKGPKEAKDLLLRTMKDRKAKLVLYSPQPNVDAILESSAFRQLVPVCKDATEAMAAAKK